MPRTCTLHLFLSTSFWYIGYSYNVQNTLKSILFSTFLSSLISSVVKCSARKIFIGIDKIAFIGVSIPIKDLAFVLYLSIWNVSFFKRVGEFWEWNCDIHKRTNYSFQNLLYIKDIIILPLKSCICICAETTFLWEFNFRFFQVLFLQQCNVCRKTSNRFLKYLEKFSLSH